MKVSSSLYLFESLFSIHALVGRILMKDLQAFLSLGMFFLTFFSFRLLLFTSFYYLSFNLPQIPLHLLYTQHLQNWQRMELLLTPFLKTAENLPSSGTFPAFSLLIMIFVFLTFTLSSFDSSVLFQVN